MPSKKPLKIHVNVTHIDCPHCSAPQTGFVNDPRGCEFVCDECTESFSVPDDAEVDLG